MPKSLHASACYVRFGSIADVHPTVRPPSLSKCSRPRSTASLAPQGIEQAAQVVMVQLVHEFQELAQFAARKAFAREPA